MRKQGMRRVITLLLSALMVLLTPMGVLAEEAREAAVARELANTKVPVDSMNTETETYYRNGDGTMTYETYRDPIRVQDEDGVWQEVDMAIVSTEEETAILSEYADPAYDNQGLLLETTAWNGKKTAYGYDKFGRLTSTSDIGDGKTLTTTYAYDGRNNPVSSSIQRGSGAITNQYEYDDLGYLVHTDYATGQKEYVQYSPMGYMVSNPSTISILLGIDL